MSFKVSDVAKKSGGPRALPSAGTKPARVLHVIDIGVQEKAPFQGKPKNPARTVILNFELGTDLMEYNGEKVPHRISTRELTVSADPKSAMFKLMKSLDPSDALDGDLEKYANLPCLLTVVHNKVQKDGEERTYANIAGLIPAPEGFPVPDLHDTPVVFNFDAPTAAGYAALPNYIHERMKKAVNFKTSKVAAIAAEFDANKPADTAAAAKPAATSTTHAGAAPY